MTLPNAKEFHEVMELAMDIATHSNGCLHWLHIGLLDKDLTSLATAPTGERHGRQMVVATKARFIPLCDAPLALTLSHSCLTCASDRGLHSYSCSIQVSSMSMDTPLPDFAAVLAMFVDCDYCALACMRT